MNKDETYYKVTQLYFQFNEEKRALMCERDDISAKLEMIGEILCYLNDILCTHGEHIYEHFEERKPQERSDKT